MWLICSLEVEESAESLQRQNCVCWKMPKIMFWLPIQFTHRLCFEVVSSTYHSNERYCTVQEFHSSHTLKIFNALLPQWLLCPSHTCPALRYHHFALFCLAPVINAVRYVNIGVCCWDSDSESDYYYYYLLAGPRRDLPNKWVCPWLTDWLTELQEDPT